MPPPPFAVIDPGKISPLMQRPAVAIVGGLALVNVVPFAAPQAAATGAPQFMIVLPVHVQVHGPVPATAEAAPPLQRVPPPGALVAGVLSAVPQAALITRGALQFAVVPPCVQVHVHGLLPDWETADPAPTPQRVAGTGAIAVGTPSAEPQVADLSALQVTRGEGRTSPTAVHVQSQLVALLTTADAVYVTGTGEGDGMVSHRFATGITPVATPAADPHLPIM